MSRVRIVTDSTADLSPDLVEKYGIKVVPLKVIFGEEIYEDGVDLTPDEFYKKMAQSRQQPTTSQPSPREFVEAYRPFVDAGDEIISIHISSAMSGTVQSARLAKSMLEYEKMEIVDSLNVSVGLGALVLEAARAAEAGHSLGQVMEAIKDFASRRVIYFTVDSLEHLHRGGRIGKAAALFGTMLNIKPVLTVNEEGVIFPGDKVRGVKKAIDRMIDMTRECLGKDVPLHVSMAHGDTPDNYELLRQRVEAGLNVKEMLLQRVGAVVGTHGGPTVFGFTAWKD